MLYSDLKLSLDNKKDYTTIKFADKVVKVKNYLPILEKYQLISAVLKESEEQDKPNVFNPVKIEMYLGFYMMILYTDIEIAGEDIDKPISIIYDEIVTNGLLKAIFEAIPVDEIKLIQEFLDNTINAYRDYKEQLSVSIDKSLTNFIEKMDDITTKMASFDKEKYQEVINFAEAANGNRPITE